jgi:uncharacterized protein (UPF0335 family)
MSEALNIFNNSKKEVPDSRYVLPGSKKEIFFKPFNTKDQKAILKAIEKDDQILVQEAFDQVLRRCVMNDGFNPEDLYVKDRECLLIRLRKESVSEDYTHHWKCSECDTDNTKTVELESIDMKSPVEKSIYSKEITLKSMDVNIVLGNTTRSDEKKIFTQAKKMSIKGEPSQAELINATYAAVIKQIKKKEMVKVTGDDGEETEVPKETYINIKFKDRLEMLEVMTMDDKKLIKEYFLELKSYGFDMKIDNLVCKECTHTEEDDEIDWTDFFIM